MYEEQKTEYGELVCKDFPCTIVRLAIPQERVGTKLKVGDVVKFNEDEEMFYKENDGSIINEYFVQNKGKLAVVACDYDPDEEGSAVYVFGIVKLDLNKFAEMHNFKDAINQFLRNGEQTFATCNVFFEKSI